MRSTLLQSFLPWSALAGGAAIALALAGCASEPPPDPRTQTSIRMVPLDDSELERAAAVRAGSVGPTPEAISSSAVPLSAGHPLSTDTPMHGHLPAEHRIAPTAAISRAPLDQWASRYPDASRELGDIVARYPEGSARLLQWDAQSPEQVQVLGDWAITHPYESLNAFMLNRQSWGALQTMLEEPSGPAVEAFVQWCRNAPVAAEELLHHPQGLAWVGQNVYGVPRNNVARAPLEQRSR